MFYEDEDPWYDEKCKWDYQDFAHRRIVGSEYAEREIRRGVSPLDIQVNKL